MPGADDCCLSKGSPQLALHLRHYQHLPPHAQDSSWLLILLLLAGCSRPQQQRTPASQETCRSMQTT
jgi:hypothetical protein